MGVATRLTRKLKIGGTRVVTAAGAITMVNEGVLVVNKTVGAASAVALQASPQAGDFLFIKDGKGDAATNNITITPAAGNIDGAATFVIAENYGSVLLMYTGTEWSVQATGNPVAGAELAFLNGVTAGTAAASKALVTDASNNIATINSVSLSALKLTDTGTLAATGTVIANAAAVVNSVTTVTGADDAKGVVLPATSGGKAILIFSAQATNGLKVYPPVNSTINGGSANAAIVIEGLSSALFVPTNATNWASLFTVNA